MASGGEEREAPSTAGSEQSDIARLRFRTANPTAEAYDIGPQRLERTTKLADVKRLIFDKWPYGSHLQPPVGPPARRREGQESYWKCAMVVLRLFFFWAKAGSQQSPSSPSDLKLVFSGRVLDSQKRVHTLAGAPLFSIPHCQLALSFKEHSPAQTPTCPPRKTWKL
jgi:hypothetical protein